MSFLNPFALLFGLLAGGIVLMYLLKLKRRHEEFSSTMLWMKSLQDLTANAPFQKLRQNPLMYLQILFLLLLAAALARPTLRMNRRTGASVIVLIDNTASMNARDGSGGRTRLDEAKEAAIGLIGNLTGDDEAMIVTFGGAARVVQGFSRETGLLVDAIQSIEPTDGESRIREALQLVQGVKKVATNPRMAIVSDGGVGYLGNLVGQNDAIDFIPIGSRRTNLGFTNFDIRESFERRGEAQAFAEIENFGGETAEVLVRCVVEGQVVEVKEAQVAAGSRAGFQFDGLSGQRKLIRLELVADDLLESDNAVQGVLRTDSRLRVALVTSGNYFLERVFGLLPGAEVVRLGPSEYDPTAPWDLVVFDQFAPPQLGPGRYLFLNAAPPLEGFAVGPEPLADQVAVDWNRLHPVTRYVSFNDLVAGRALSLTAPDWTTPLVDAPAGPLMLAGDREGLRLVCIAFELDSTDWMLQPGFPIFIANSVEWLGAAGRGSSQAGHKVGETLRIPAGTSGKPVKIEGPEGAEWTIEASEGEPGDGAAGGFVYFNNANRVGMYEATQGGEAVDRYAINLLSRDESDVTPRNEIIAGEQKIVAVTLRKENREIWPWLAMVALGLLAVEWHWYCRRSWV